MYTHLYLLPSFAKHQSGGRYHPERGARHEFHHTEDSPCPDSARWQQPVLQEYLPYHMHQPVSQASMAGNLGNVSAKSTHRLEYHSRADIQSKANLESFIEPTSHLVSVDCWELPVCHDAFLTHEMIGIVSAPTSSSNRGKGPSVSFEETVVS
eukprot:gnl/TRDRNA2_/TRDRNA2_143120_c2_seq1.p1 gnl/TRDRNA2_/TRDRNA2_143120_c2~~gnl/TRDRNA2_/TRDRNA2_143120_c2_seq1.p1  ORF type:complete len:153 (-),score=1.65 gnl/TRDRNA2_/TRDRNA2_143120_c2_seq1:388-846(-)